MIRTMLKSKIHRALVTDANLEYEGSVTIDALLMDAGSLWARRGQLEGWCRALLLGVFHR